MSIGGDLQLLTDACQAGAHQLLDALIALGPRPATSPGDLSWDQRAARLRAQMDNLTGLTGKLSADAVIAGMAEYQSEARKLGAVTANAKAQIEAIADVSRLLTTLSRVLDVGLAVLALATTPSPAGAAALIDTIAALDGALNA